MSSQLRGMATVSYWADDVPAAVEWYSKLLDHEPYFVRPNSDQPEYVEFRIGDYQDELGIISSKYKPKSSVGTPGGAVLYWHVDDIEATLDKVKAMGAIEYQPLTPREAGFVTASVIDPFGNILGLMYNPHYLAVLEGKPEKE
jgi:predicted enzyme related to lactoylglutathione lyase